ncbi:hypothetical protein O181_101612 [Austropuccinia psidii MF-1]|uniref:Uncharacterized protein n=1 Tax=Austropuccinia psidii MF-1 TaxID=1389203 RepID=A0A9Q3JGB8_9BASI|nr:hypothetical protein [Austropuccinia psidii MF-1]
MISPILLSPQDSTPNSTLSKRTNTNTTASSNSSTPLTPPITTSNLLPISARFVQSPSVSSTTCSNQSCDNILDMESEDCHWFKKNPTSDPPTTTHNSNNPPNSQVKSGWNPIHQGSHALCGICHYLKPPNTQKKLHKQCSINNQSALMNHANFEYRLPESFKIIFNIVNEGMFRGHEHLSIKLKEKFLEQFPLVRDSTTFCAEETWIIETYSVYFMHLERALREVEESLGIIGFKSSAITPDQKCLAKNIMHLEEQAAIQGGCGLAIFISKPFQKLSNYPSTHEYEN